MLRALGDRLSTAARLARWLGPWSGQAVPEGIPRTTHAVGATRAYVFTPRDGRASGTYLVLPGLHFAGPDDPRLDRFCRVLAAAGHVVVAPFIRAFSSLVLDASLFDDARAAMDLALALADERGHPPPALFSISFGSRLALDLAAREPRPSAALLFGGYAEFVPTVRFAVTGRTLSPKNGAPLTLARDPLNSPVVFLNLLPELALDGAGDDARRILARAWVEMVHATWGKMELKEGERRRAFAEPIAARLSPALRAPFLRGCCLEEGSHAWLDSGLEAASTRLSFLDATSDAGRARCPVALVHGRDDDVIPFVEAHKLERVVPASQHRATHMTGLYGHTGSRGPELGRLGALAREGVTLLSMLDDLARAPRAAL